MVALRLDHRTREIALVEARDSATRLYHRSLDEVALWRDKFDNATAASVLAQATADRLRTSVDAAGRSAAAMQSKKESLKAELAVLSSNLTALQAALDAATAGSREATAALARCRAELAAAGTLPLPRGKEGAPAVQGGEAGKVEAAPVAKGGDVGQVEAAPVVAGGETGRVHAAPVVGGDTNAPS